MICTQRTALLASSALRTPHQARVGRKWKDWGKRGPRAFRFDGAWPVIIDIRTTPTFEEHGAVDRGAVPVIVGLDPARADDETVCWVFDPDTGQNRLVSRAEYDVVLHRQRDLIAAFDKHGWPG